MPSIINATITSGLTANSDVSGNLIFQTSSNNVLTLDNTQNATFTGNVSVKNSSGVYRDVYNGIAKAWVNFNPNSPVVINSSYNVSSITRTGTGAFTINFTSAMDDTNYSAVFGGRAANGVMGFFVEINDTAGIVRTATQLAVYSIQGGSFSLSDTNTKMSVAIYR